MKELEVSSVMEGDGNVEKAEAYAKELEDVSDPWIYFILLSSNLCFGYPNILSASDVLELKPI